MAEVGRTFEGTFNGGNATTEYNAIANSRTGPASTSSRAKTAASEEGIGIDKNLIYVWMLM
jgi:hypothetical protein